MPHSENMTSENLEECARVKALFDQQKRLIGMTHKTLGKMVGKSDKTISAIVNGRMRVTIDMGRKFAKVFGVPLSEILPWTAVLSGDSEMSDVIDDLQDLNAENREIARRMIRNLLDSQEEA